MTLADTAAGMPQLHFIAWLGLAAFLTCSACGAVFAACTTPG